MFAPAAAHLCNGVPLEELGTPISPALLTPGMMPLTRIDGDELVGEVLWIDRFGNAQLNVDPAEIEGWGDRIGLTIDGVAAHGTPGPDVRRRRRRRARLHRRLVRADHGRREPGVGRRRCSASAEGDEVRLRRLLDDDEVAARPTPTKVALGPSRSQPRGRREARQLSATNAGCEARGTARQMRRGTTIAIVILLLVLIGATALQLVLSPARSDLRPRTM